MIYLPRNRNGVTWCDACIHERMFPVHVCAYMKPYRWMLDVGCLRAICVVLAKGSEKICRSWGAVTMIVTVASCSDSWRRSEEAVLEKSTRRWICWLGRMWRWRWSQLSNQSRCWRWRWQCWRSFKVRKQTFHFLHNFTVNLSTFLKIFLQI